MPRGRNSGWMPRFATAVQLAVLLAGCSGGRAGAGQWAGSQAGMKDAASGTAIERFFPLVDGRVYHYTRVDDANEQGLLVARVFRSDKTHGELRFPSGVKRFEYAADGVLLMPARSYVLKTPLSVGETWRGEHGGATRIIAVDVVVDVPAGHFTGCVQTLEDVRGDRRVRYATTFCPETGVVVLEAASGASLERAELKSYGAPVQVGPDGVERIQ
jgi:hypothetical protein